MHALPLQLGPGSDLHQSLSALGRDRQASGFVLSVVGNLSQAAFQCPGQSGPTLVRGDLEIITLQGTIGPAGVHLHLSLSDGTCQVFGGHLEPGTVVQKGAEILVGWLEPAPQPQVAAPQLSVQSQPGHQLPAHQLPEPQPLAQLVVRSGCPWCGRAEQLLRTLGIRHSVVPTSGEAAVPQLLVDGETFVGYTALVQLFESGALDHLMGG